MLIRLGNQQLTAEDGNNSKSRCVNQHIFKVNQVQVCSPKQNDRPGPVFSTSLASGIAWAIEPCEPYRE
jgi:hypothetical protein